MTVEARTHDRTTELQPKVGSDGRTIEGYIAVFDTPVEITDWLGTYTETISRGAFARTLNNGGPARVRMQFDHGYDALFGGLPIGVWEDLHENERGLWGRGRVHDTWHTVPIRAAIESGALRGQSFRFRVPIGGDTWNEAQTERNIRELALLEGGPVVWPAYEQTTLGVRHGIDRGLDVWRAILRGEGTGRPDPTTPDVQRPGLPVVTTLAERRRRALVLRGVVPHESTGEAAAAAS